MRTYVEVLSANYTFAKRDEAVKQFRALSQLHKSKGINSRVLLPETGQLARIFIETEFESAAAREEHWDSIISSGEFKALPELSAIDMESVEHSYYREPAQAV